MSAKEPTRSAACYVFCLYGEKDAAKVDPFNLAAWEFFVVATARLDSECGQQQRIGIAPLRRLCASVAYDRLKEEVDRVLDGIEARGSLNGE